MQARFNSESVFFIERVTVTFVILLGNWAIYYWIAVLVFDASYATLKHYSPVYLIQLAISFYYLRGVNVGSPGAGEALVSVECQPVRWAPTRRFIALAVSAAMVLLMGAILIIHHFKWSSSPLAYNLLWVMLLPIAAIYVFWLFAPVTHRLPLVPAHGSRAAPVDTLLFLIGTAIFASLNYDTAFFTPDDAYYAHVISATLANPHSPVQGADLLQGTSTPYSIHPAYRGVGYEVLIALIGDIAHRDPLHLYYRVFPVFGSIFWLVAAYTFFRVLRNPLPGLAVMSCLLVLLFWTSDYSPSAPLRTLNWGKSLLALTVAPILFIFVSTFVHLNSRRAWVLLVFAVCGLATLSSTSLLVIPVSIALACMVFLNAQQSVLRTVFYIALAVTPVVMLIIYSLLLAPSTPMDANSAVRIAPLLVSAQAFGGVELQAISLVMLLILPAAARNVCDLRFQRNMLRLCLAGFFTLMAPYVADVMAVLSGVPFMAVRIFWAFPLALLTGSLASIAVAQFVAGYAATTFPKKYVLLFSAVVFYCVFLGLMKRDFFYTNWRSANKPIFDNYLQEAMATRALIPDDAVVAAGVLDDALAMLPDPPIFVHVRHYLEFHKHALSDTEYADRVNLYTTLRKLAPMKGEDVDAAVARITSTADTLGVSTLVFANAKLKVNRQQFAQTLSTWLISRGYSCATTPADDTWVCNRSGAGSL